MSAALRALLGEVGQAREALDRDELLSPDVLHELSERVRSVAPGLPRTDQQALAEAWDALVLSAEAHRERIGEELRRLGSGRRALRGYAHLRGHKRGQRLNKSV